MKAKYFYCEDKAIKFAESVDGEVEYDEIEDYDGNVRDRWRVSYE